MFSIFFIFPKFPNLYSLIFYLSSFNTPSLLRGVGWFDIVDRVFFFDFAVELSTVKFIIIFTLYLNKINNRRIYKAVDSVQNFLMEFISTPINNIFNQKPSNHKTSNTSHYQYIISVFTPSPPHFLSVVEKLYQHINTKKFSSFSPCN